MKIGTKEKSIEIGIVNYQYPFLVRDQEDDPHDANWLLVRVDYTENRKTQTFREPCLLTWELAELAETAGALLRGDRSGYISDFLEPYLKIAMSVDEDIFMVQAHFVYSTAAWSEVSAAQMFSRNEFSLFREELQQMLSAYPER